MSAVIFLDFDGPMIPLRAHVWGGKKFDPVAAEIIDTLATAGKAEIVISSNWRLRGYAHVAETLTRNGLPLGKLHKDWATPELPGGGSWSRWKEIKAWLDAHPDVDRWVAFDDEELPHSNAVTVTLEDGILSKHYEQAKRLLGIPDELIVI